MSSSRQLISQDTCRNELLKGLLSTKARFYRVDYEGLVQNVPRSSPRAKPAHLQSKKKRTSDGISQHSVQLHVSSMGIIMHKYFNKVVRAYYMEDVLIVGLVSMDPGTSAMWL